MAQPASILNLQGFALPVHIGLDGVVRLPLLIGDEDIAGGITPNGGFLGVATHKIEDTIGATDKLVVLAGKRSTDSKAMPLLVDASGRPLVTVVSGGRARIAQTPTISTSIYAAKDAIGDLMTFANAGVAGLLSGVVEAITIVDKGQQMAAMDLVLFSAAPGAPTDNAAFDPTDAELATIIGAVKIVSGDYFDFNDNAVASVRLEQGYVLAGTSLYGVLVSRGTPTYVSTSDLTVTLTVRKD